VEEFGNGVPDQLVRVESGELQSLARAQRDDAFPIEREEHNRRISHHGIQVLVRDAQSSLDFLALGDVEHDAAQGRGPTALDYDGADVVQPDGPVVGRDDAVLELVRAVFGDRPAPCRGNLLAILRMEVIDPEVRILGPGLEGVAEKALRLPADEADLQRLGLALPDDPADAVEQPLVIGPESVPESVAALNRSLFPG
jgi:hypothetical protein